LHGARVDAVRARTIAVIGGGWAGCAAAVALADAGVGVELFEAAPQLGGRARRVSRQGLTLDNGQHLLLGAYRETRALLSQLHERPPITWRPLAMAPFADDQPGALTLRAWRLPAPFNLLMALLCAKGLRVRERIATLRWFAQLRHAGYRCGSSQTVAQLTASLPAAVADRLWHPLCLSALNTHAERASAQVFANVLRAAFDEGGDGSDLMHPDGDLGALVADAAQRWLRERGHRVELQTTAHIADACASRVDVDVKGLTREFSAALVAVAPHQLARTFADSLIGRERALGFAIGQLADLAWEPITTVYLGYAAAIDLSDTLIRLDDRPGQWLFARPDIVASANATAPALVTIVAVVLSAHGPHDAFGHDALVAAVDSQLRARRAAWPPLRWSQVIEEKRATYACTAGASRPAAGMLVPGIALAGDYTDDQFPATLEAAVRSGRRAAAALVTTLR
jgi:squalene-associated FAD-dependent desaturase